MSKELQKKRKREDLSATKKVYNSDVKIEWLKFPQKNGKDVEQHNKPGTISVVNHQFARKMIEAKKAKIGKDGWSEVERKVHEPEQPLSKVIKSN